MTVRNLSQLVAALTLVGLVVVGASLPATQPARAAAGTNKTLNFQGRLLNSTGAVIADGNYNMEFKLYQDGPGNVAGDTGGTLKWTEDWLGVNSQAVTVKNGYFSVNLGSITAFSSVDWNQDTLWLSMNVAGGANATSTSCTPFSSGCSPDGEMLPMRRLTSSVYALNSAQLGGLTSSQFVQLAQGVQSDSSTTQPSLGINKTTGSQNIITLQANGVDAFDVGATGNVTQHTTTNSSTAFQLQNAANSVILGASTTGVNTLINNPSVEGSDNSNWALKAGTGTTARDATQAYIGSASEKVALTSTAIGDGVKYTPASMSATTYTLSFEIKQTTGTAFGSSLAVGYNNGSDNNCTLSPSISFTFPSTSGWTRYACTFTATGSPTYLYWKELDAPASARTFFLDAIQLETGSTATAFNEGGIQLNGVVTSPTAFQNTNDSNSALTVQKANGTNVLTVDTLNGAVLLQNIGNVAQAFVVKDTLGGQHFDVDQVNNRVIVGGSSYLTGTLALANSSNANLTLLTTAGAASGNQTITLPDLTGTVALVQAGTPGTAQTGNLNVSGTIIGSTALQSALLDTPSGTTTLNIGTTNATAGINLNHSTTIAGNLAFTNGGSRTISLANATGTNAGADLTIQGSNASGTAQAGGNIFLLPGAGTSSDTSGSVVVKSQSSDSLVTFTVHDSNDHAVLSVDTLTPRALLGTPSFVNGALGFASSGSANVIQLQSASSTAGYTLTLPTTAPSTSQCLQSGAVTAGLLTFGSCGTSGSFINNATSTQIANFNVQSASSSSVAGIIQGASGQSVDIFEVKSASATNLTVKSDGSALIQPTSDSATAFAVRDAGNGNQLTVDTANDRIGVALGGGNVPTMNGPGIQVQGGIELSSAANTGLLHDFATPLGGTVSTRLSVDSETLGSGRSVMALGLTTSSNDASRALIVYDARSTSEALPALAVVNATEDSSIGLTWRGGSTGYLTSEANGGANSSSVGVTTGDETGGNNHTTGSVIIATGTGAGGATNVSSGGIAIDPGAASGFGTAGAITIGATNASSLALGRSGAGFTLQGTGLSTIKATSSGNTTTVGFVTPTGTNAINFPNAGGTICTTVASTCGGASGAYVALQGSTPGSAQTGNINVNGTVLAATVDATGSTLSLGTSNATGGIAIGNPSSSTLTTVRGTQIFRPATSSDSTTAFQIQNAGGTSYLTADSVNQIITTTGDQNVGAAGAAGAAGRVFSDGFESGSLGLWSRGTTTGAGSTLAADTAQVRNGEYSARIVNSSTASDVETTINQSSTFYFRGYFYATSNTTTGDPALMYVTNSGSNIAEVFRKTSNNHIMLGWGAALSIDTGVTLPLNQWNLLEAKITPGTGTAGAVALFLNGTQIASNTATNTAATTFNVFGVGDPGAVSQAMWADDVSVDTVSTGVSSSLNVLDSLHVAGTTSLGGAVLVRPVNDVSNVFQIQNSGGVALLSADTSASTLALVSSNTTSSLLTATNNSATTGTVLAVTANALTSGAGLSVASSGTGLTGTLLSVSSGSTAASTNGLARFNFTGAHTGSGVQVDDATATGTAVKINANAVTSGSGLFVQGTNTTLTGNLLAVQSASTSAATNGLARFNFTGAHTGNGLQIDDSTATGTAVALNANAVTSGAGLVVAGTNTTLTGNLLRVQSASTAAATNGLARFNFTGAHTGVGLQVDDATATGTGVAINGSALTSGNLLSLTAGAATVTTGNTLAVANGRSSFTPTMTVASASGAAWDGINVQPATATVTGATGITNFNLMSLYQPTITDASAVTVTNAATLMIAGAPTAAGSVTITNADALNVVSGNTRLSGGLIASGANASLNATGSSNVQLTSNSSTSGTIVKSNTNSSAAFQVQNAGGAAELLVDSTSTNGTGAQVNYLSNPGFETGTTGWSQTSPGVLASNSTKANTWGGLGSAQLTTTSSNGGIQTTSFTSAPPAGQYTISFYVKPSVAIFAASLLVTVVGTNTQVCNGNITILPITGFTRVSCTIGATTGPVTSVTIAQTDNTARVLYFDGIQFQPGTSATPFQMGTVMLRGVVTSPVTFMGYSNSNQALTVNNATGTSVLQVDTINGNVALQNTNPNSQAFIVKDASGFARLTVDTSTPNGDQVIIGQPNLSFGGVNGKLSFANASNTNFGSITASAFSAARTYTLPDISGTFIMGGTASAQSSNLSLSGTDTFAAGSNGAGTFNVQTSGGANILSVDSTTNANKVYVGPTAGDTNGALLVLGKRTSYTSGSQVSEPTGVAGAMYFNSALGAFRCYQVDHWEDCMQSVRTSYHYTQDFMGDTFSITGSTWYDGSFKSDDNGLGTPLFGEGSVTPTVSHPGIDALITGTNAGGGASFWMADESDNNILLGNGDYWRYETSVNIPTLSVSPQTFTFRAGFSDGDNNNSDGAGANADYCIFKYSDSVNSGKWQGTCDSNSGTASTCDTGVTVAASTWYRLTITANAAGNSVDFRVNGSSACQVSTAIPTGAGRNTSAQMRIIKTAGTTSREVDVDYLDLEGQFGTSR